MSDFHQDSSSDNHLLDQIIAEFLRRVAAGEQPDRQELLARHPDLATDLQSFFIDHDRMQSLAEAGRGDDADIAAQPPAAAGSLTPQPEAERTLDLDASQSRGPDAFRPGGKVRYFGSYELLEEIARGGMGVVFKARQRKLNRIVALKMILAGQLASGEDVQRFYTEAEAAAQLDHPGIVPIFEVGEHQGQHFFSMGYVEGQSLSQRIAQNPLPPREAAELLRSMALAVLYAHEKGVIHRDLKPGNVLMQDESGGQRKDSDSGQHSKDDSPAFVPKIVDFGLAKHVEADSGVTATGQILGTPSYMPPEQAAGKTDEIGPRSDVYSLGAVQYCMLTGRPPFQASTPMETLVQVLDKEPVSPRQLNPRIPRDLETICLKCLEKSPGRRYQSARELADDVSRFLQNEPIYARPVGVVGRSLRWGRRNPAVAALLALVLLVFAAGTAISTTLAVVALAEKGRADEQAIEAGKKADDAERERGNAQSSAALAQEKATEAEQAQGRAAKQLNRSEWLLYASQIQAAQREWEAGNIDLAWQHLESCRWDFRGWEHDYLYTLFTEGYETLHVHTRHVSDIVFSPDGKQIASADGGDKTIRIWDVATRNKLLTLRGHEDDVRSVAYSPDGKKIASGSLNGTVRVWSVESGETLHTLSGKAQCVDQVSFSPDGSRIVCAGRDNTVRVWHFESDEAALILRGHLGFVTGTVFSPDGKCIYSSSEDGTVRMWDAESGKILHTFREGHRINDVSCSSEGTRVAASCSDGTTTVWDTSSAEKVQSLKGHACEFLQERVIVVIENGAIKVWDVDRGQGTCLPRQTALLENAV